VSPLCSALHGKQHRAEPEPERSPRLPPVHSAGSYADRSSRLSGSQVVVAGLGNYHYVRVGGQQRRGRGSDPDPQFGKHVRTPG
jgi:hypothetical protein